MSKSLRPRPMSSICSLGSWGWRSCSWWWCSRRSSVLPRRSQRTNSESTRRTRSCFTRTCSRCLFSVLPSPTSRTTSPCSRRRRRCRCLGSMCLRSGRSSGST
eukprot:Amastigsp_a679531_94.p4 type:complete len:103 gc:universal Amastigsp_a679531_94:627-319(-)